MDRAVAFYRDGLGLPAREDKPPVVYFALHGTWMAVFPRESLRDYIGMSGDFSTAPAPVTLSCNVASITAVDETLWAAQSAGARIVCPAKTFRWGGYAGWFADPDGHLWEIVFNPRPFME